MNQGHLHDLDDWEVLPDEQIDDNFDDEKVNKIMICSSTILKFQADYFSCPQFVDNTTPPAPPPPPHRDFIRQAEGEDDPVLEELFNDHQKEEMVIKVESPKSRAAMEEEEPWDTMIIPPPPIEFESSFHLDIMGHDYEIQRSHGGGGAFNIWKWGVSAISSLGVTAAALCILIFSNNNNKDLHHNQKLQFPIYSHPQAKNRGVHQASTIMAVRGGARVTRARIICGGCYKGTV